MDRSAATKVFGNPELLEKILLDVPSEDILVLQRMNRDTRNVVIASLKLQRKLFFCPTPSSTHTKPIVNPLLERAFNSACGYKPSKRERIDYSISTSEGIITRGKNDTLSKRSCTVVGATFHPPLTSRFSEPRSNNNRFVRGSWRMMLISNPPCDVFRENHTGYFFCKLYNQNRLGDLADATKRQEFIPHRVYEEWTRQLQGTL